MGTQQVRALQVYMVDLIATEYEAKCSALIVVVNAQADALSGKIIGIRKATYPLFSQLDW